MDSSVRVKFDFTPRKCKEPGCNFVTKYPYSMLCHEKIHEVLKFMPPDVVAVITAKHFGLLTRDPTSLSPSEWQVDAFESRSKKFKNDSEKSSTTSVGENESDLFEVESDEIHCLSEESDKPLGEVQAADENCETPPPPVLEPIGLLVNQDVYEGSSDDLSELEDSVDDNSEPTTSPATITSPETTTSPPTTDSGVCSPTLSTVTESCLDIVFPVTGIQWHPIVKLQKEYYTRDLTSPTSTSASDDGSNNDSSSTLSETE